MGLLGLAFDPNFATNHFFYVNYTASGAPCQAGSGMCTKIVRYTVPAATPNDADEASAFQILEYAQPFVNHNGGMMTFGPDGMLWIAAGDGGSARRPERQRPEHQRVARKAPAHRPVRRRVPGRHAAQLQDPAGQPVRGRWRRAGVVGARRAQPVAVHVRPPDRRPVRRRRRPGAVGGGRFHLRRPSAPRRRRAASISAGTCARERTTTRATARRIASRKPQIEYTHDPTTRRLRGDRRLRLPRRPPAVSLYGAYFYADFEVGHVWAGTARCRRRRLWSRP